MDPSLPLVAALLATAPAAAADPPVSEEGTVEADRVRAARQAVVDEIVSLGYDRARARDGRTVFVQDAGWKGKVVLYDDGRLATRRRAPRLREPPPLPGTNVPTWMLCAVVPTYCIDAGSVTVSDRRWKQVEDRVARATAAPLGALGDRLADAALQGTLDALPARLDALWAEGRPLEGERPLPTFRARRAALYAFWDTRTETAWGAQVRDIVGSFVRAEVQASDHPFPGWEQEQLDAARRSAAPFPWTPPDAP
ncbi:MAG: hypothetical protein R3F59_23745 [Myxococcota bacterium]